MIWLLLILALPTFYLVALLYCCWYTTYGNGKQQGLRMNSYLNYDKKTKRVDVPQQWKEFRCLPSDLQQAKDHLMSLKEKQ